MGILSTNLNSSNFDDTKYDGDYPETISHIKI